MELNDYGTTKENDAKTKESFRNQDMIRKLVTQARQDERRKYAKDLQARRLSRCSNRNVLDVEYQCTEKLDMVFLASFVFIVTTLFG